MSGERVMIVEDELLTRVSLVAFLEEMGYDAAGAERDGCSRTAAAAEL